MFSPSLILLILTNLAFATPQPQNAGDAATTTPGRFPTADDLKTDTPLDSESATAPDFYSDAPTLALSIYEILATAIPDEMERTKTDYHCNPTTEAYFSKLPKDVTSVLLSYHTAAISWAMAHSSELGDYFPSEIMSCMTSTGKDSASATGGLTASVTEEVTGFVTTVGGVVETGVSESISSVSSATGSSTITSVASVSGSGIAAGVSGSVSRNGTAAAGSVTSTRSPAAAPRATGAVMGSLAGFVGVLGVMAML